MPPLGSHRPTGRVLLLALLLCYSVYYLYSTPPWTPKSPVAKTKTPATVTLTQTETETQTETHTHTVHTPAATVTVLAEPVAPPLLNGPPTKAFADNLRAEVQYITSWTGAGFTNDVIAFMNLIYLARDADRVPILPYFTPTHIGRGAPDGGPTIDFGEVFDVPRLAKAMGRPVLEWWEVKDRTSTTFDPLGCWNLWQAVSPDHHGPHESSAPFRLKLDIAYTVAPKWVKLSPQSATDEHVHYPALVALGFPENRRGALTRPFPKSPMRGIALPPDEHLLCFDYMYWAASKQGHEVERDFSPAWRFVGTHLHWTPKIEALAAEYLRVAFGLAPASLVPPYIAIHARRGDFDRACGAVPRDDCLAPLSAFARRVAEVRAELKTKRKIDVVRVVMTSDEADGAWWGAVRALGWAVPDHAGTAAKHGATGRWYPVLIDGAILSGAVGFVGTAESTLSIVGARRVEEWNGGAWRMVRWKTKGADDH
ncbi:hypothetical protein B0H17DRAFT_933192 [Mycena rosella]|uniref:GDP-fucose protein O-fucosyltransferase n=1 Tax=Mycena rosella TaxID=1033263 RepID=A0AAD7DKV1_MYCRO|nr:hypothetical protein B0H17DRAFT_933192 [Mycena rosella]